MIFCFLCYTNILQFPQHAHLPSPHTHICIIANVSPYIPSTAARFPSPVGGVCTLAFIAYFPGVAFRTISVTNPPTGTMLGVGLPLSPTQDDIFGHIDEIRGLIFVVLLPFPPCKDPICPFAQVFLGHFPGFFFSFLFHHLGTGLIFFWHLFY